MAHFAKRCAAAAAALSLGVIGVACGVDDDGSEEAPGTTFETTTTDPMGSNDPNNNGNQAPNDVNPNNPGADDQAPPDTGSD